MITALFWMTLACILLYGALAVRGPSVWDRLLGLNLVSTKIIIVIIAFASMQDLAYLLDLAIIYTMFGFIGTIFITLYLGKTERGNADKKE